MSRPAGIVAGALLLGSAGLSFVSPAARPNTGALRGSPVGLGQSQSTPLPGAGSVFTAPVCSLVVAATAAAVCRRAAKKDMGPSGEEIAKTLPRPEDLLESPKFPKFLGSSGGYFSKNTRERHAITWTSPKEQMFEMPTGGIAFMNKGENLCYFRKKEQCICVGKLLRKLKIENYKIFRIAKDGTVKFMHPADGVFPDKVNKGREPVNFRPFSTGSNPKPGAIKGTYYSQKPYEADALTTMFVKAKYEALADTENLFPLPQPPASIETEEELAEWEMKMKGEAKNWTNWSATSESL
eukprot:TRINITY_DN2033_c0_g1_i4.p2 TRINITY_DN2033_c0_g1~~TRINITY_DN2033_c0_g1_i4.p2  ORF type:complete len:296 (-),score=86.68 TRINITY_DN2033_c0_g1_i4:191-1078(-)